MAALEFKYAAHFDDPSGMWRVGAHQLATRSSRLCFRVIEVGLTA
jgi:hypothetical protein